jgi:DNA replicative helicase MCM subunit Mcm2 (Cdc46/Mcm family)
VRDHRKEDLDKKIASHVVSLHMRRLDEASESEIGVEDLKKYLTYAKMKIFPRLGEEAGAML